MIIALDPRLAAPFTAIARRRRWLRTLRVVAETILLAVALFSGLAAVDYFVLVEDRPRQQSSYIAYGIVAIFFGIRICWALFTKPPAQQIALWLESSVPELKHHALAAVELSESDEHASTSDSPIFRQLLKGRVASVLELVPARQVVPAKRTFRWLALVIAVLLVQVVSVMLPESPWGHLLARATMPWANLARVSSTKINVLEPASLVTHVAANESLQIKLEIESKRSVTPWIETKVKEQATGRIVPIPTTAGAMTFEAPLAVADKDMQFRVRAGDGVTEWRTLVPSPRPAVETYEVTYTLPAYANEEPRKYAPTPRGDLRSLVGSEAIVKMRVNHPLAEIAVSATWDQAVKSNIRPDENIVVERTAPTDFQFRVPLSVDGSYQVTMTSLASRLQNIFPPRNLVEVVEDLPPRVRFTRMGIPSTFCRAKDVLTWQIVAEDELSLPASRLEYAINDGAFRPVDLTIDWQDVAEKTDRSSYRVASTAKVEWDIAGCELASGDLLKTRVVLTDLAGQETQSTPIVLRVASEYFTPDRHVYLRGRLQFLELMER